ncbi:MAG: sigma-54-dependent Fis family transcriptional regulator [Alphaproteobacteria bacterium]|nr:sigma-54-dependent Fis family transcriptional regulator [Alphaproteobacteria bacterium]
MPKTILIVDDDATQRRILETTLSRLGYGTLTAPGGREAIEILARQQGSIDLVLLDMVMPDMDGLEVLERLRPRNQSIPIVVLTAHGGVDQAVKAIRAGADDFVVKPASPERLRVSIENALKLGTLTGELSRLSRHMGGTLKFDDLVMASPAMRRVVRLAERAAASSIPILIEGESGVGKELIARAIQGSGERAGKPFVVVNCAAIPENLVESILFGHERGSFTGATERHVGKFQEASGGTLFLDEIGELKPDMQVKLLRALQEGEVDPVGARQPVKVDIRLISATNRDLGRLVREGRFREDLYYRLHVFPIPVPALRERPEDIEPLIRHFIAASAATERKSVRDISAEALDMLRRYPWPGNVRQLENAIFRAVVLCDGERLGIEDFPQVAEAMGMGEPGTRAFPREVPPGGPNGTAGMFERARGGGEAIAAIDRSGHLRSLEEIEADMIRLAIQRYDGRMSEVARRLRIGRSTLYRKVRELGIELRESA